MDLEDVKVKKNILIRYDMANSNPQYNVSSLSTLKTPSAECKVTRWLNTCPNNAGFTMFQRPQTSINSLLLSPPREPSPEVFNVEKDRTVKQNILLRQDFNKAQTASVGSSANTSPVLEARVLSESANHRILLGSKLEDDRKAMFERKKVELLAEKHKIDLLLEKKKYLKKNHEKLEFNKKEVESDAKLEFQNRKIDSDVGVEKQPQQIRQSIDSNSSSDSKRAKRRVVTVEAPMSPESRKKSELCTYLQLMDLKHPEIKNGVVYKNRRSTRVKNLQILSEKRELEKKLSVEARIKGNGEEEGVPQEEQSKGTSEVELTKRVPSNSEEDLKKATTKNKPERSDSSRNSLAGGDESSKKYSPQNETSRKAPRSHSQGNEAPKSDSTTRSDADSTGNGAPPKKTESSRRGDNSSKTPNQISFEEIFDLRHLPKSVTKRITDFENAVRDLVSRRAKIKIAKRKRLGAPKKKKRVMHLRMINTLLRSNTLNLRKNRVVYRHEGNGKRKLGLKKKRKASVGKKKPLEENVVGDDDETHFKQCIEGNEGNIFKNSKEGNEGKTSFKHSKKGNEDKTSFKQSKQENCFKYSKEGNKNKICLKQAKKDKTLFKHCKEGNEDDKHSKERREEAVNERKTRQSSTMLKNMKNNGSHFVESNEFKKKLYSEESGKEEEIKEFRLRRCNPSMEKTSSNPTKKIDKLELSESRDKRGNCEAQKNEEPREDKQTRLKISSEVKTNIKDKGESAEINQEKNTVLTLRRFEIRELSTEERNSSEENAVGFQGIEPEECKNQDIGEHGKIQEVRVEMKKGDEVKHSGHERIHALNEERNNLIKCGDEIKKKMQIDSRKNETEKVKHSDNEENKLQTDSRMNETENQDKVSKSNAGVEESGNNLGVEEKSLDENKVEFIAPREADYDITHPEKVDEDETKGNKNINEELLQENIQKRKSEEISSSFTSNNEERGGNEKEVGVNKKENNSEHGITRSDDGSSKNGATKSPHQQNRTVKGKSLIDYDEIIYCNIIDLTTDEDFEAEEEQRRKSEDVLEFQQRHTSEDTEIIEIEESSDFEGFSEDVVVLKEDANVNEGAVVVNETYAVLKKSDVLGSEEAVANKNNATVVNKETIDKNVNRENKNVNKHINKDNKNVNKDAVLKKNVNKEAVVNESVRIVRKNVVNESVSFVNKELIVNKNVSIVNKESAVSKNLTFVNKEAGVVISKDRVILESRTGDSVESKALPECAESIGNSDFTGNKKSFDCDRDFRKRISYKEHKTTDRYSEGREVEPAQAGEITIKLIDLEDAVVSKQLTVVNEQSKNVLNNTTGGKNQIGGFYEGKGLKLKRMNKFNDENMELSNDYYGDKESSKDGSKETTDNEDKESSNYDNLDFVESSDNEDDEFIEDVDVIEKNIVSSEANKPFNIKDETESSNDEGSKYSKSSSHKLELIEKCVASNMLIFDNEDREPLKVADGKGIERRMLAKQKRVLEDSVRFRKKLKRVNDGSGVLEDGLSSKIVSLIKNSICDNNKIVQHAVSDDIVDNLIFKQATGDDNKIINENPSPSIDDSSYDVFSVDRLNFDVDDEDGGQLLVKRIKLEPSELVDDLSVNDLIDLELGDFDGRGNLIKQMQEKMSCVIQRKNKDQTGGANEKLGVGNRKRYCDSEGSGPVKMQNLGNHDVKADGIIENDSNGARGNATPDELTVDLNDVIGVSPPRRPTILPSRTETSEVDDVKICIDGDDATHRAESTIIKYDFGKHREEDSLCKKKDFEVVEGHAYTESLANLQTGVVSGTSSSCVDRDVPDGTPTTSSDTINQTVILQSESPSKKTVFSVKTLEDIEKKYCNEIFVPVLTDESESASSEDEYPKLLTPDTEHDYIRPTPSVSSDTNKTSISNSGDFVQMHTLEEIKRMINENDSNKKDCAKISVTTVVNNNDDVIGFDFDDSISKNPIPPSITNEHICDIIGISPSNQNDSAKEPEERLSPKLIEFKGDAVRNEMKSLRRNLLQNKRKSTKLDASRDEYDFAGEKSERRSSHTINLNESDGQVLDAYYFDYNLIITQDLSVSFWTQSALGFVLEAQNMWIHRGAVQRLALDSNCVRKISKESVTRTENSFAHVELWTKEHKSDKRERPVADVFAVIYFWRNRQTAPEKKFLQLENIKGFADDVQYVVLKNSAIILVSWRIVRDDITSSIIHCYQLANDFQTVVSIKEMESVEHTISSLHNIEDCDTLVMGCGEKQVTIWNLEFGFIVATIDTTDNLPEPSNLWVKCDRGFLFLLQKCADLFKLIAINGINQSWKRLQIYKPPAGFEKFCGVCIESGILIVFYDNGILCWNIQSGDLIMEEACADVKFLPSNKHIVTYTPDNVFQVKNALSFLITNYDFSES